MPVTSVDKDLDALTMTIVADFPVPLQRLWDAYADPRQLERFWGPVQWPATFTRHDFAEGGRSEYTMRGPDGETSSGYFRYLRVEPPHGFEVIDGFANDDGSENTEMPTMRMVYSFEETAEGSRMTGVTYFNSAEQLEQLLQMGMEEGTLSAMSQMDAVLADLETFAAGRAAEAQLLSDTQIRVARVIRGTPEQVWRAHHEPALLKRWMTGPDGWEMVVCEVAQNPGDTHRTEWVDANGENRFGFTGTMLESAPPYREKSTEGMIGDDSGEAVNELTLTPVAGGTLLSIVITYPSKELRDMVLATGMVDGMESSYARMEREALPAV